MRKLLIGLVLFCPELFGAYSVVQAKLCTGSSPITCSFTSLPAVGHVITVAQAGAATVAVTDNQTGNSYGIVKANGVNTLWSSTVAGSAGTFTITATVTGGCCLDGIEIVEHAGISKTTDGISWGATSATDQIHGGNISSLTTTIATDVIVCGGASYSGANMIALGSFTLVSVTATTLLAVAYRVPGATVSAQDYQFAQSTGAGQNAGVCAAFLSSGIAIRHRVIAGKE